MCRTPGRDMSIYLESLGTMDREIPIASVKLSKNRPNQHWSNLTCHSGIPNKKGQIYYFVGFFLILLTRMHEFNLYGWD